MVKKRPRSAPIIVPAVRWLGPPDVKEIRTMVGKGVFVLLPDGRAKLFNNATKKWHALELGDWVVSGLHNEFAPVKNQEFERRYRVKAKK